MRWRNNHLLILLRNRSDTKSPFAFPPHRLKHLHCRGITSSVSVMSSPSFDSFADPQQGQLSGAAMTTRSRGR